MLSFLYLKFSKSVNDFCVFLIKLILVLCVYYLWNHCLWFHIIFEIMINLKNWIIIEIKKHLEINSSQYEILMIAFSDILRDFNFYNQKLNIKKSKFLLQNCINSNLNKLSDYVWNKLTEVWDKMMKNLIQWINFNQSKHIIWQH